MPICSKLDRLFTPISPAEEITPNLIAALGLRRSGALTWEDLLQHPRVVVLADGGSGKTWEFEDRVDQLRQSDQFAFFAPIESLHPDGLRTALTRRDEAVFDAWLHSGLTGWFFLDSVDEAKLTRVKLELALNRFAKDLGDAYDRARVILSCRGLEWTPRDLAIVQKCLPPPSPPVPEMNADEVLYSVLPERGAQKEYYPVAGPAKDPMPATFVVGLLDLTRDQRRRFLADQGVTDLDAFEDAIVRDGLEAFVARPADLLLLAAYWGDHGRFGSLVEMMEFTIVARLRERPDRPHAQLLSPEQARDGAERLAAAMSLGHAITLRYGDDFDVEGGTEGAAIDPAKVLGTWRPDEVGALLSRPLFAAASYGRLRFHHRWTLEFLTATWLKRLGDREGGLAALRDLIFVPSFDITAIPPSLRATVAWLCALDKRLVRDVTDCDPVLLLQQADPSSLSVPERERLLEAYARRDVEGSLSDHYIEPRALSKFSDARLGDAVRTTWTLNGEPEFHLMLLRIIEAGAISDCADLAEGAALDPTGPRYNRITAARALEACGDPAALRRLAEQMLANPSAFNARIAPHLAAVCFPSTLSVAELFRVMAGSQPARPYQVEGFGYALEELWNRCPVEDRDEFIDRLGRLCLKPPIEPHGTLSQKHKLIARRVHPVARAALLSSDGGEVSPAIVRLLQVAERGRDEDAREDHPNLYSLVAARPEVKQKIFWADVALSRTAPNADRPTRYWELNWFKAIFWQLDTGDRAHLEEVVSTGAPEDRAIALSALWSIFQGDDTILDEIAASVAGDAALSAQLKEHRTPRQKSATELKWAENEARSKAKSSAEHDKARRDLAAFRDELQADPGQIADPKNLKSWPDGAWSLFRLTRWLAQHRKSSFISAAVEWRALAIPFGQPVADAYREGMRAIWRVTPPAPPTVEEGRRMSTKTIKLSVAGLNLQAAEDRWTTNLSSEDARQAVQHAIWADEGYPEYLNDLIRAFPTVADPLMFQKFKADWALEHDAYVPFLYKFEASAVPLSPALRKQLFDLVATTPPTTSRRANSAAMILRGLDAPTPQETAAIIAWASSGLAAARAAKDSARIAVFLGVLLETDATSAMDQLDAILAKAKGARSGLNPLSLWADLFGRSRGRVGKVSPAEVQTLGRLVRSAYYWVDPEKDVWKDGEMDTRDEAQMARDQVLGYLTSQAGRAAYDEVTALAKETPSRHRAIRFSQLARGMAQRAAERDPWTPETTRAFEESLIAPTQTGSDLYRLVLRLLDEIIQSFDKADFSSGFVLQTAASERAVQHWLAESLQQRGRGRFHVTLEKQVSHADRPDITISSTSADVEVALELKHGNKEWTFEGLVDALEDQLAERYLRPANRRHGILVISFHRTRRWHVGKSRIGFEEVLSRLQTLANGIVANSTGAAEVAVRGLDVAGFAKAATADDEDLETASP